MYALIDKEADQEADRYARSMIEMYIELKSELDGAFYSLTYMVSGSPQARDKIVEARNPKDD